MAPLRPRLPSMVGGMTTDQSSAGAPPAVDPEYMRVLWRSVGSYTSRFTGTFERRQVWSTALTRAGLLLERTLVGRPYRQYDSCGEGLFPDALPVIALVLYGWNQWDLQEMDDAAVVHDVLDALTGHGERPVDCAMQKIREDLLLHGHDLDDPNDQLAQLFQELVRPPVYDPTWGMDLPSFLAPWTGTDFALAVSRLRQVLPAYFGPDPRLALS